MRRSKYYLSPSKRRINARLLPVAEHEQKINVAEWIIAIGSLVSVVIIGIQSHYLRQSLDVSFKANTQEFILQSCRGYFQNSGTFLGDIDRTLSLTRNLATLSLQKAAEGLGLHNAYTTSGQLEEDISASMIPGCNIEMAIEFWETVANIRQQPLEYLRWNWEGGPICGHIQAPNASVVDGSLSELEAIVPSDFRSQVLTAKKLLSSFSYEAALRGQEYQELSTALRYVSNLCVKEIQSFN